MMKENISLRSYNTFGINAATRYFAEATTEAELEEILTWYRGQDDCPLLILGGGSNMLFTRDWPGLALKISLKGKLVQEAGVVTASAGEPWHEFVLWTLDQGLFGLENLSLIPGQVGTAPMQNIGAYGVELKDVFAGLEAVNILTGARKVFSHTDCQFGYRDSVFKHEEKGRWIITAVTFQLSKKPQVNVEYGSIQTTLKAHGITKPTPTQVSQAVTAIRQSKLPDPAEIGNAGSFFKNPVITIAQLENIQQPSPNVPYYQVSANGYKVPAGWLIEQAGWKGTRRGDCGVHEKQALVLVNHGNAKGADLWQLAEDIQADVAEKFDIQLQPEVNVV